MTQDLKPLRVFVAEDDATDLFWVEMVLKNAGIPYSLVVAREGEAAQEYLMNETADLILLDMNMPFRTAAEILRAIPNSDKLPLRILTGSEFCAPQFRDSVVQKPLTQEKLADCLQSFEALRPFAEKLTERFGFQN